MKDYNADMIVANDVARKGSEMGSDTSEVFLISKDKKILHLSLDSKKNIARKLFDEISLYF
jgi:phosphopantothenoylcysteine synthetase/decarboxylase